MALLIDIFLCRTDNYGYLVHDVDTGKTAAIDAPDAKAIKAALERRGWDLSDIFVTHHHTDHVEGIPALAAMLQQTRDYEGCTELDIVQDDNDPGHCTAVISWTTGEAQADYSAWRATGPTAEATALQPYLADNDAFFSTTLAGRDEPLGSPGGAARLGVVGVDTPLVTGLPPDVNA